MVFADECAVDVRIMFGYAFCGYKRQSQMDESSLNTSLRLGYQVPGQAKEGGIDLNDALDAVKRARQSGGSGTGALWCLACSCGEQGSDDFRPGEGGV